MSAEPARGAAATALPGDDAGTGVFAESRTRSGADAGRAGSGRDPVRRAMLAVGIALLALLVREIGTNELLGRFLALGWRAPLLLWPFALIALVDGAAWSETLPRDAARPSIGRLALLRLAGESVNNLTPTAYLGGEPVKAMLLVEQGLPAAGSTVSVVVAKTALTVGQVVFVLLGIVLAAERFDLVAGGRVAYALLCLLAAAFVGLLVHLQRRQLFGRLHRLATRFGLRGPRIDRLAEVAPRIDAELNDFYSSRSRDFAASSLLHFVGWLAGTVEVKVFADLLRYPISWRDCLVIESISQPLAAGAAIVPGAIGLREAGGVAIFRLLGLDESAGLALWLLRRLREAFYSAVGLLFLVAANRRRRTR